MLECVNYVTYKQTSITNSKALPTTFTSNIYTTYFKTTNMKKTIFFALLAIFSLSAAPTFASKNSTEATPAATENKLSAEAISNYRERVEEIRDMDKSEMTVSEKSELKNELKDIKKTMSKDGAYIYIGGGSILLILILLLILF